MHEMLGLLTEEAKFSRLNKFESNSIIYRTFIYGSTKKTHQFKSN